MAAAVLEVDGASVRFDDLWALRDVSLVVPEQQTIGLIGPNGAGKSTLLNVIAGRQVPTSGSVTFHGRDVTKEQATSRARQGIRRTFQDFGLFAQMSVRDSLLVASGTVQNKRGGRRERRAQVDVLMASLDLSRWADIEARMLPHPVQRLVAYAMAVAGEPALLLLDEPAAGLSEQTRRVLAAQLREDIRTRGLSVVLVEHDMGFVRELCDHAYVLNAGGVIASGTFDQISRSDVVKAAYLGDVAA